MIHTHGMGGRGNVVQESQDVVAIRCGCGDPGSHNGTRCDHEKVNGQCASCARACPTPRLVEDLGTVAYRSASPWRNFLYRVYRRFRPNGRFWLA